MGVVLKWRTRTRVAQAKRRKLLIISGLIAFWLFILVNVAVLVR